MVTIKIKFAHCTKAQQYQLRKYYSNRQEKPIGNLNQQFVKINPFSGLVIIDK